MNQALSKAHDEPIIIIAMALVAPRSRDEVYGYK